MPWRETSPMNERIRFVADFQHGLLSMTELCERYYISRKTGYKWLDRFEEEGPGGLEERSRRPLHCPHKTPEHIEEEISAGAPTPSLLGPQEATGVAETPSLRVEVARHQYRCGHLKAQRADHKIAAPAAPRTPR
jgi:transposase